LDLRRAEERTEVHQTKDAIMVEKTYITSENVATFAKVQNAAGFADRGDVVLAWDELDREEKKLAKNIDIDELKVRTTDPRNVPDKWTDNIVEDDAEPDAIDFIKQIIANPARYDVYEILKDYDPPEPLMLWWVDKCFSDADYFRILGEACRYGLFKGDTKYLWAAMAFGVDAGEGRFRWVQSDDESQEEKELKQKILEQYDIREKELELLWEDVKPFVGEWMRDDPEEIGIDSPDHGRELSDDEEGGNRDGNTQSLLDM